MIDLPPNANQTYKQMNRELCIQLELFTISTSSEMITKAS